jgi:hypothetical protein
MNTLHTPGPWEARFTNDQMSYEETTVCQLKYLQHPNGYWVVTSPVTNHGDEESTARFIAAAPELLEKLQWIIKKPSLAFDCKYWYDNPHKQINETREEMAKQWEDLLAVVAKATCKKEGAK